MKHVISRPAFIRSFVIATVILSISAAACTSLNRTAAFVSGVFPGEKEVKNARPVPPFVVENFRDSVAVRFLVVGDWGTGASFQKRVAAAMASRADSTKPAFILSMGDNIYNSGVSSVDDPQWKTKFEDIYTAPSLQLPWYAILGNHDYRGNVQAQIDYSRRNPRWNMPARYYTLVKQIDPLTSVEFFMIDTDPMNRGVTAEIDEQKVWLKRRLDSSKAHWKIAIGHHMIRSHGGYGDQDYMIRHIKPLLDSAHVDLYMCGHDHDLQYLKAPEDAFYCLISGAGGEGRVTSYGANTIFAATNGGFNVVAITRERIYIEFVNIEGKVSFATSIRKRQVTAPKSSK
jgi:acid phosphatase